METRKLLFTLASLAILAAPVLAAPTFSWTHDGETAWFESEGTVSLNVVPNASTGGPFVVASATGVLANYVDVQTWCLESEITMIPGKTYHYTLDAKVYGGQVFGVSGAELSKYTKYIYSEFLDGAYPTATTADYAKIRNAIWYAQGVGGSANTIYTNAVTAVDGGASYRPSMVLNLWTLSGNDIDGYTAVDVQSHIIVPTPGAILLAGIGTTLVGLLRRRKSL